MKTIMSIFLTGLLGLLFLAIGLAIGFLMLWIGGLLYNFSGWALAVYVCIILAFFLGYVLQQIGGWLNENKGE